MLAAFHSVKIIVSHAEGAATAVIGEHSLHVGRGRVVSSATNTPLKRTFYHSPQFVAAQLHLRLRIVLLRERLQALRQDVVIVAAHAATTHLEVIALKLVVEFTAQLASPLVALRCLLQDTVGGFLAYMFGQIGGLHIVVLDAFVIVRRPVQVPDVGKVADVLDLFAQVVALVLLVARCDDNLVVAAVRGLVQYALQREVGPLLGVVDVGTMRNAGLIRRVEVANFKVLFQTVGQGIEILLRFSLCSERLRTIARATVVDFVLALARFGEPLVAPLLTPVALHFLDVQHLLAVRAPAVGHANVRKDVGLVPVAASEPGALCFVFAGAFKAAESYASLVSFGGSAAVLVVRKTRHAADLIRESVIVCACSGVRALARFAQFRRPRLRLDRRVQQHLAVVLATGELIFVKFAVAVVFTHVVMRDVVALVMPQHAFLKRDSIVLKVLDHLLSGKGLRAQRVEFRVLQLVGLDARHRGVLLRRGLGLTLGLDDLRRAALELEGRDLAAAGACNVIRICVKCSLVSACGFYISRIKHNIFRHAFNRPFVNYAVVAFRL